MSNCSFQNTERYVHSFCPGTLIFCRDFWMAEVQEACGLHLLLSFGVDAGTRRPDNSDDRNLGLLFPNVSRFGLVFCMHLPHSTCTFLLKVRCRNLTSLCIFFEFPQVNLCLELVH